MTGRAGAVLALLSVLLAGGSARAFHWTVRHGYSACRTCHMDPSGAGLLTAYGRGLAETVIRTHYRKRTGEEEPGRIANFMFGAFKTPEWLAAQVDSRHLVLVPTSAPSRTSYTLMQLDAAAQVKLSRFRAYGSLGYARESNSALFASVSRGTDTHEHRVVSRTHWLGVDLGAEEQFLLRAGRMNLPYGLRNIEHTTMVRTTTRTNINAQQQLGLALAWNSATLRAELMGIAGNFQIRPDDYRERGYSGYLEWTPREKLSVGVSSQVTHARVDVELGTALWRHAHGVFGRWSPVQPLVLSVESSFLLASQPPAGPADANNMFGEVTALLVDYEPVQGLHLNGIAEVQNRNIGHGQTDVGLWAGAFWFFLPHVDFRTDVAWVRAGGRSGTSVLFQLHGYL